MLYIDQYHRQTPNVQIEVYQLIGIVALMLAVKMQEDVVLTHEQAHIECQQQFATEMMEMVERDMLTKFDYSLNTPTSLDLVLQLLYLDDNGELAGPLKCMQIQNMVTQCLPILFLCQTEYSIAHQHSQLSIGLASLLWVLRKSE